MILARVALHDGAGRVGVVRPGNGLVRVAVLAADRGGVASGERFGLGGCFGDGVAALDFGVDGGEKVAGLGVCEGSEVVEVDHGVS